MPTQHGATIVCVGSLTSSVSFGTTTTETTIFSKDVPYGILEPTGTNLHVRVNGYASSSAVPPTLTLRLYYGSSLMVAIAAAPPALAANQGFIAESDITTRGTGSAFPQAWALYPNTPQGGHAGITQAASFTTGTTTTVALKGQYGAATAGNTVTFTNCIYDVGGLI